jgi:hypothetical protein
VSYQKAGRRWRAQYRGFLGWFKTKGEARAAVEAARER